MSWLVLVLLLAGMVVPAADARANAAGDARAASVLQQQTTPPGAAGRQIQQGRQTSVPRASATALRTAGTAPMAPPSPTPL